MYIQVRNVDGKSKTTVTVSKVSKVKELKDDVAKQLGVPVEKQRMFFRGKQLENDYTLFDYGVNLNDVVQLLVREDLPSIPVNESTKNKDSNQKLQDECAIHLADDIKEAKSETPIETIDEKVTQDEYFKVGDIVDCKAACGGWFEAQIKEIVKNRSPTSENKYNSYKMKFVNYHEPDTELEFKNIRPRANVVLPLQELKKGQVVLANYNADNPDEAGFWYTCHVKTVSAAQKPKLIVTVELGREELTKLDNCNIKYFHHVFRLEEPKLITERTESDDQLSQGAEIPQRELKTVFCDLCKDAPVEQCNKCGCQKCFKKSDPSKTILCDECDDAYHLYCLDPPLQDVPSDDWYCPLCKNDDTEIVKAGEKLKFSKRKSQMASNQSNSEKSRDWGKGMACVGRTTVCTIVPLNHFGPVPGIEVGTTWKYRLQVSEAGIHRPHVAGIHGRESEGAYSIVLSGGYEDDVDKGETFLFSGSGGRDLSGNKRTAEQSGDQELTRNNLALARNCNAPINNEVGATAKDWRNGKPVRVVRNYKASKDSKYAPKVGNRYDGIYKVVKYYPEKGKSGFLVWRFELRRDDPTPAPWTQAGKKLIASLGLDTVLNPPGYEEVDKTKKTTTGKKRSIGEDSPGPSGTDSPPKKKLKTVAYNLPSKLKDMIKKDTSNAKLWESFMSKLDKGKQEFLSEVQNTFVCICCFELVNEPVTTECKHNFCKTCLTRSFKSECYSCAHCRQDLGKNYEMKVNDKLQAILNEIFPGYNRKR